MEKVYPTASSIAAGLKDADDPLAFIKANLREAPASDSPALSVPRPVMEPDFSASSDKPVETAPAAVDAVPPNPVTSSITPPEPSQQTAQTASSQSSQPEAPETEALDTSREGEAGVNDLLSEVAQPKKTKEDSMRDLRAKIKEQRDLAEERARLIREREEELARYKEGVEIPQHIKERLEQVDKLERFRELHDFKSSRVYQDKFVKPMVQLQDKAVKIAKDYNVPTEVLNQALAISNKREQNTLLKRHFDDVGAIEVRSILDDIQRVHEESAQAEAAPLKALETLQQEARVREEQEEQARRETIVRTSRGAWVDALTELQADDRYPELQVRGEPEHDKYSKPIIDEAAKNFGQFVRLVGEKGIRDLPADAAKILAKNFLLASASSVAMVSRSAAYERAQEIEQNAKRRATMFRPQFGSATITSPVVNSSQKPKNPTEAAEMLLNKVLAK